MLIMTRMGIRMIAILELMMLPLLLLLLLMATVAVNATIFIVTNDVSRSSGKSLIIEIHRHCHHVYLYVYMCCA